MKSEGVTFSTNSSDISGTTFGLFLEHECNYEEFEFDKEEKITSYGVEIGFEDAKDYSHSYQEISDYVEKLSLGVTGEVNDDEDVEGGTEWGTEEGETLSTCYLVDDSNDYMTIIEVSAFSNFYEDWDGYNTLIAIEYTYIPKKDIKPSDSDGIYNWVWKDKKGKEYTPKVIKNIQKNKGNDLEDSTESIYREDSTESVYREDSTEISKETNNNMPAWKQAYIDYFNNSSLDLSEYNYILEDVNSDNIPELFLFNSMINDREFYYVNKNNEVKSIEFTKSYIRAENGRVYITGGSQGYYYDSVSRCNASGDYESMFDGYYEEDLSGDTVSFLYYIGNNIEVSEEDYERKLAEYKEMKEFGEEDSNQGDVISAIQNY